VGLDQISDKLTDYPSIMEEKVDPSIHRSYKKR
jgi:hypothetical protein